MRLRWAMVGMLASLMIAHLGALLWGVGFCTQKLRNAPGETAPACIKISDDFQRTAESYIAVILALMAVPGEQ